MLNKNFNRLLSAYFGTGNTTNSGFIGINGSITTVSGNSFQNSATANNSTNIDTSGSGQTGVFLFTEEFEESIETCTIPTEFTNYSVESTSKMSASDLISFMYSRTIIPKEDATIKSIGLITAYTQPSALIAFENLAEPVQLTAGEPHTFTFTIKV